MNDKIKDQKKPGVFDYFDHKLYCKDFFDYKKSTDRKWSYEHFARKAGLHKTYLSGIIHQNNKNVGLDQVPRVVKGLGLNSKEGEFFEVLVKYNRARNQDESLEHLKTMMDLKAQTNPVHQLEKEKYDFFSKWHYAAIYEFIKLRRFNEFNTPKRIAEKLRGNLKEKDIIEALSALEDLGMIKKDRVKGYVQVKGAVTSLDDDHFYDLAKYNYHKEMTQLTLDALENHKIQDKREISGLTVAVPEAKIPEILEKMRKLRREINKLSESYSNCDRVYQLSLNLFPLSKD